MKKIVSLFLIVVLLFSFAGCNVNNDRDDEDNDDKTDNVSEQVLTYDYLKQNLSDCVTVDKVKFENLVAEILMENPDVTADSELMSHLLNDEIYRSLGAVETRDQMRDGKIGSHDIVYYNYYAEVEGHVIYASEMKPGAARSMQLGISENGSFEKKLEEKLLSVEDVSDYIYSAYKNGADSLYAGQIAYISYVVEYTVLFDDGIEALCKEAITYERVTVGDENHDVASWLVGAGEEISDFEIVDANGYPRSYSNIKVDWVVDSGEPIVFTDVTFRDSQVVKDVRGNKIDVKDKELTYYVYPGYYVSVPELSAENILNSLLPYLVDTYVGDNGTKIEKVALPSFADHLEVVKEYDKCSDELLVAKETYEEAICEEQKALMILGDIKDSIKKGETATEAQQDSINKAQVAYDSAKQITLMAKATFDEKVAEYNEAKAHIYAVIPEHVIINEYKDYSYAVLKEKLCKIREKKIAVEIIGILEDCVNIDSIIEEAVDSIYDFNIDIYKDEFKNGIYDSNQKITNKKQFGSFERFLVSKLNTESYEMAKNRLRGYAEQYVIFLMRIYCVADIYGCELPSGTTVSGKYQICDEDLEAYADQLPYLMKSWLSDVVFVKSDVLLPDGSGFYQAGIWNHSNLDDDLESGGLVDGIVSEAITGGSVSNVEGGNNVVIIGGMSGNVTNGSIVSANGNLIGFCVFVPLVGDRLMFVNDFNDIVLQACKIAEYFVEK